eukprot:gnl/Hemi2/8947_TR3103_c0_g1_i1.p1 gnl/Hemi2/8947_TR3103_c0_g1~~gnl/Hemi2/8947_TR3103_c0_g1_i1.p1  ORF type:complete len:372 (+),score=111.10 gnl/Hemi2/8947_TR3103_c0_g1_i1:329-1444(+)
MIPELAEVVKKEKVENTLNKLLAGDVERIKLGQQNTPPPYPHTISPDDPHNRPLRSSNHPYVEKVYASDADKPKVSPFSFFAVYDGHGGTRTCRLLKERFHLHLLQNPSFWNEKYLDALAATYHVAEASLEPVVASENCEDGSTAVTVLFVGRSLYLANAGDARAILCRDKKAWRLSIDHKPDDTLEQVRIEKAGGSVSIGRVAGSLSISRCFGDINLRMPWNKATFPEATDHFVISTPHTMECELGPQDSFILLTCDGMWERNLLVEQEACDIVMHRRKEGYSAEEISTMLVEEAERRGSTDNITCILIFFKWSYETVPLPPTAGTTTVANPSGGTPSTPSANKFPDKRITAVANPGASTPTTSKFPDKR